MLASVKPQAQKRLSPAQRAAMFARIQQIDAERDRPIVATGSVIGDATPSHKAGWIGPRSCRQIEAELKRLEGRCNELISLSLALATACIALAGVCVTGA